MRCIPCSVYFSLPVAAGCVLMSLPAATAGGRGLAGDTEAADGGAAAPLGAPPPALAFCCDDGRMEGNLGVQQVYDQWAVHTNRTAAKSRELTSNASEDSTRKTEAGQREE
jgi:hypothetical protein